MPQLDVLTYGSQFIYLVISFVAVYILTLRLIIPSLVAIQKLRQKLNTVASLNSKLNRSAEAFSPVFDDDLYYAYEGLANENLSHYAKPQKPWLTCKRMAQICQAQYEKKDLIQQTLTYSTVNS